MTNISNFVNFLIVCLCLTFSAVYARLISYDKSDDFYKNISERPHFVLFYTSWCAHCLRVKPVFETLAERYNDSEQVNLAKVDCDRVTSLCSDFNIIGYPTLLFFWGGHEQSIAYKGKKSLINLVVFVEKMLKRNNSFTTKSDMKHSPAVEEVKSGPFELTSSDFQDVIISARYNFVKFFVPWCSHCQAMSAVWKHLRDDYANSKKINIAKIDCTKHHNVCNDQGIVGYPSLIMFKNGASISQYYGERDYDLLKTFIGGHLGDEVNVEIDVANSEDSTATRVQTKEEDEEYVGKEFDLVVENFRTEVAKKIHLVLYFISSSCQDVRDEWIEFRKTFVHSKAVTISRVDCSRQNVVCQEEGVLSFPSVLIYYRGKKLTEHKLDEGLSRLRDLVRSFDPNHSPDDDQEKSALLKFITSHIIPLSDESMESNLVLFYRPQWEHIELLSTWVHLTRDWSGKRSDFAITAVNHDDNPTISHSYQVHSLPAVLHLNRATKVEEYANEKSVEALNEYINMMLAERDLRKRQNAETERVEL